ncbi:MAG: Ig-like domain-containing protein [Gemmatimonadaceae bacterium]
MSQTKPSIRGLWATLALAAGVLACNENLPNGPTTFVANLAISVSHDTIVIGDSSAVKAVATDGQGRAIQQLSYTWASADPATIDFAATATPDTSQGRARTLVAKRTGRTTVTLSLPDARFVSSSVARSEVGVVGGVKVLTTHDSTLTSVNDTAVAIAVGLAKLNGALVNRTSTGLRWIHNGQHVTLVGQGDTVRYIAQSTGVDTLIATHDFCLAGAKCADTVFARVNQTLLLTLSARTFNAWSFNDSVGPAVTLADKRGNGLNGTQITFVPATFFDSAVVHVTAPIGVSNPVNGSMAVPKLVAAANGAAKVYVRGIGTDGFSILATDSVTAVVRQVARRVAAEPLRVVMTGIDSVPIRPIARDARGSAIADATITLTPSNITMDGIWAGPTIVGGPVFASVTPDLSGVALPANNPLAPQVPFAIDASVITLLKADTAVAGNASRTPSVVIIDSTGVPAVGKWVRFGVASNFTSFLAPDSVQADGNGQVSVLWVPSDSAANYTLTGVRGTTNPLNTVADSAGRVVIRQTLTVKPDVPSAAKSTLQISATTIAVNTTATITVTVRDQFNNIVRTALTTDFVLASTAGAAITNLSCTQGVCTATYTAPAVAGPDMLTAKIGVADMLGSPMALTIQ